MLKDSALGGSWRCGNLSSFLSLLSGFLGFSLYIHCALNKNIKKYQPIITGGGGSDVLSWSPLLVAVTSVASVAIGALGMRKRFRLTLTLYLFLTGSVLFAYFLLGLVITEQRSMIQLHLHTIMATHFQSAAMEGDRFGVAETWDYVQIQMSCCGVDSYRDYLYRDDKGMFKKQDIPYSCCFLKTKYPMPEAENLSQCMHDASLAVADSRFLNTKGCHGSLSRWYIHHISTISGVVFLIICLQGIGVFYLSWLGYRRSAQLESNVMRL